MNCAACCVKDDKDEVAIISGKRSDAAPGFQLPLDAVLAGPDNASPPPLKPESAEKPERVDGPAPKARDTEPVMFNAKIPKGDRKLGIDINYHDTLTLLVTKVNAGPVEDFNRKSQDTEVAPGDRIIVVNGVTGDTQNMLEACKNASELDVTVQKCEERTVLFEKRSPSDKLGLQFDVCDGMTLLITKVEEGGLVEKHNQASPEFNILQEDRVIGVNGVRSDANLIKSAMEGADRWDLTIRRVWKKL